MPDQSYILVIEDNDFVRMQIVKFLQDGGYGVYEATNVEQAVDAIRNHKESIRCMLVDVRMEPADGFDFLNKMQAENISIPAILATGDQNSDVLSKASNFKVVSVLMKPVNKDRLLQMVARAISGSGAAS